MSNRDTDSLSHRKPSTGDPDLIFVDATGTDKVRIQNPASSKLSRDECVASSVTVADLGIAQDHGQPGDLQEQ